MPRMDNMKIHHMYVAEGLAEDYEDFINKCTKVSKLSYEKFCDVWKETNFVAIFQLRPTEVELAEFTEEALHLAKYFMVSNINNYEKSVAALFLIYAILNLQPFHRFAALRLGPDDVSAVENLELVARREKRHDILYILGHVLIKGPCEFHASARERALEFCYRKYFEGALEGAGVVRPKGVFHRHNEEIELLKEMKYLEKCYTSARDTVMGDHSMSYTNDTLCEELESSMREVSSALRCDLDDDDKQTVSPKKSVPQARDDLVSSIKQRAMKAAVNPMRHLQGVEERNKSTLKPTTPPKAKDRSPNKMSPASKTLSPVKYPWRMRRIIDYSLDEGNNSTKSYRQTKDTNRSLFNIDDGSHGNETDVTEKINGQKDVSVNISEGKTTNDQNKSVNVFENGPKSMKGQHSIIDNMALDIDIMEEQIQNIRKRRRRGPPPTKKSSNKKGRSPKISFGTDSISKVSETTGKNIDVDKIPILIDTDSKGSVEVEIIDDFDADVSSENDKNLCEPSTSKKDADLGIINIDCDDSE